MVACHLSTILGKRKWKVTHLANVTGIRYNTLLDLYNEMALGIKFEHIDLICKALDCSSEELIEYTPDKSDKK